MILILNNGLIYWSGVFTGLFFVLMFFGCSCNFDFCRDNKILRNKHKLFMRLSFIFFLIHLTLVILGRNFGIYI